MGRNALKGYVRSVVLRNNTITGVTYRDDPTIMAWDLVNEPFNPGDDTGKVLTVSVATIPCRLLVSTVIVQASWLTSPGSMNRK